MIFSNLASQRSRSRSLELFHHLPANNEAYHRNNHFHDHDGKLKKSIHMSFVDLFHWHQPLDTFENKNTKQQQQQQQQQESYPRRPSIIKPSDIPRSISKKSVTFASFASVFNLPETEYEKDHVSLDYQTENDDKTTSGKEFVIVIRNRQLDDDTTTDSNESTELYSMHPKTSLSSLSQSNRPINIVTTSHHSRKNLIHHLLHHRHQKKCRHSNKTINPVSTMNRSYSAPNILFSSPSSLTPTTPVRTNNQEQPSKNVGTWFKSSSLGRFVKSLGKHPHQNVKINNTKTKRKTSHRSSKLRRLSEYIYFNSK